MAFNAVTVPLSSGTFQVYNLQGALDVIADVNGYYRASAVDDLETRLAWLEAAQPVVVEGARVGPQVIDGTRRVIAEADVDEPVGLSGTMVASYSVNVEQDDAGAVVECLLGDEGSFTPSQQWESPGSPGGSGHISGSGKLQWYSNISDAPAVFLLCRHSGAGSPTIATNATVNMTFYPDATLP